MWTHTMNMHNNKLSKKYSLLIIFCVYYPKSFFYFKFFSKIFILSKKPLPKTEVFAGKPRILLKVSDTAFKDF